MSLWNNVDADAVTRAVDASSGVVRPADLAFVFGNSMPDPAFHAAALYHRGLVPAVVVTGGPHRFDPSHVEAEHHAGILRAQGVPPESIIVERTSRTTAENVAFARPLLHAALGDVTSVIAVVVWYHVRAVYQLAAQLPGVQQIHTLAYEHEDRWTGRRVTRRSWPHTGSARRVLHEYRTVHRMRLEGELPPLTRSSTGWTRRTHTVERPG
ncbi:YdcF family protein [Streptomyces sp. NPDC056632]|uniref:YdcF family protein n=1 Tax=Streptomyces sp. NPDC056632 TaxID=3345884 RepID=UPI0036B6741B